MEELGWLNTGSLVVTQPAAAAAAAATGSPPGPLLLSQDF